MDTADCGNDIGGEFLVAEDDVEEAVGGDFCEELFGGLRIRTEIEDVVEGGVFKCIDFLWGGGGSAGGFSEISEEIIEGMLLDLIIGNDECLAISFDCGALPGGV